MAKKPVVFRPQLHVPEGINNFSGNIFDCFTVGDSLPFEFTFTGTDVDVTGWTVTIAIAKDLDAVGGLSVDIPVIDVANGMFAGDISSADTKTLTPGLNYALAKYTDALGDEHIIDMCVLEVYQNLDFTLA